MYKRQRLRHAQAARQARHADFLAEQAAVSYTHLTLPTNSRV
ncbi:hypothetical protein JMUB7522_27480 [Staphylococcus aureus]